MISKSYQVTGMTCAHCVNAVTGEVATLPDVTDVQVDLTAGRLVVTSNLPLDDAKVAAAVDEAGYSLTFSD